MNWDLPDGVESFLVTCFLFLGFAALGLLGWGAYALAVAIFGPDAGPLSVGALMAFLIVWAMLWSDW